MIDGQEAAVFFSGLSPGFAGLYQVNAFVPEALDRGEAKVRVEVGNQLSPPVTMAVQ